MKMRSNRTKDRFILFQERQPHPFRSLVSIMWVCCKKVSLSKGFSGLKAAGGPEI